MRSVLVTGIGPISCAGIGVDNFWRSVIDGISGIEELDEKWAGERVKCRVASLVKGFKFEDYSKLLDRETALLVASSSSKTLQLGIASAFECLKDSGIDLTPLDRNRLGVFCGTFGNLDYTTYTVDVMRSGAPLAPACAFLGFPGTLAGVLSSVFDARGPADTISGGCPSGMDALGHARSMISQGVIDIAIVVGSDNEACELTFSGIDASNGLSVKFNRQPKKASRPFDRNRGGNVIGENACALLVESAEHAMKRGAQKMYARIDGYAKVSAGSRIYSHNKPSLNMDGPSRCFKAVLADAKWNPSEVSLVAANGSASVSYDKLEAWEISKVFPNNVKVQSIKGIIGQSGSGCALLQIAAACLSLKNKIVFGTVNFEEQDPALPVLNISKTTHPDPNLSKIICHAIGLGGFHFSGLALSALPAAKAKL